MKTRILLLSIIALALCSKTFSQCSDSEAEVKILFSCPTGDCDISIYASDQPFTQSFLYSNFSGFTSDSAAFCIPQDQCLYIQMYNNSFDGIIDLTYTINVDGVEQASGTSLEFSVVHYVNCLPGAMCETPLLVEGDGSFTAEADDTWYTYTPTVTGTYHFSTCTGNTCDTKIWLYTTCPWNLVEGPPGTYAFNDEGACGVQADTDISLEAGDTYLMRIGDNLDDCEGSIDWTLAYVGPIIGCMDAAACNYNPIAQEAGDCLYFPNPDCASPDLLMNVETLLSSMYMMETFASACDVEEGMVTGDGTRTVITFSVRIDNVGEADYYIGNPLDNPEMFETVNCHGHVHYAGYGDYRLMDMAGNIIPAGHKNGFCVMDVCGYGQFNCGTMGISVGCYDQYGAGTSGQWLDVTDVPDGTYRGLVTVNPLHLADGLGKQESDYDNNTYVFCFELFTDESGRNFTLLGDCPPFIDCMGVENGVAEVDCNGECNGPSIWGDVAADNDLNDGDMSQYLDILEQETITVTTCNDLSANGAINIYDVALANVCVQESEIGGTSACEFPHNILTTSGASGMAITEVNFDEGYIDVELKSLQHDIIAYQFSISGVIISSVSSLTDPGTFDCTVGFNPYNNNVFGLGTYGQKLDNTSIPYHVCRIYFSQITDNTICIDGISDIVTNQRTRTATYVYGNCTDATEFAVHEIVAQGDILLMPNPVTNNVYIQLSRFAKHPSQLIIRDNLGRIAMTIPVQGNNRLQVDLSSLLPGVYSIGSEEKGAAANAKRFVKL